MKPARLPSSVSRSRFGWLCFNFQYRITRGFRSVLKSGMLTTNWEVRKQSPHYLFYSLERFRMVQKLRKLRFLLLLLILDMVEEDSGGSLTILCMALRMRSIQDHLHALRPYNFYPPVGFYPTGSHDPYWTRSARHEELFLKRFRFRLPDFHRLMRAMKMDGEYFTCDPGKKK